MSTLIQTNCHNNHHDSLLPWFFISAVFFISAAAWADGNTALPPSYRTPLSEMVYDRNDEWRAVPEEKNPWRENQDNIVFKSRIKAEMFPLYENRIPVDNSHPSIFQHDGTQQERPTTNIFKYTF